MGRRAYDSAATRKALLEAGRQVFDELGYDGATTREIGERAGVDPALISRYFGSKEGLFLAVINQGPLAGDVEPIDPEPHALLGQLLRRWEEQGPSPVSRALATPTLTKEVREQVRKVVADRVLGPLTRELGKTGEDRELRAELLIALVLGVALTRSNGTLDGIARASLPELTAALGPLIDAAVADCGR
ncbi:MAG TPA: TetR family transcriptional regulator [Solirubrobacterales bacterium]|nr:TetR family transcriptional regulator [Solirubrobacterales bacterium]